MFINALLGILAGKKSQTFYFLSYIYVFESMDFFQQDCLKIPLIVTPFL